LVEARPLLKEWRLVFKSSDNGIENCAETLRELATFLKNEETKKFDVGNRCRLSGKVYGRAKFEDGDEIMTSRVTNIERVEKDGDDDVLCDLFLATTESGSRYYVFNGLDGFRFTIVGNVYHLDPEDDRAD